MNPSSRRRGRLAWCGALVAALVTTPFALGPHRVAAAAEPTEAMPLRVLSSNVMMLPAIAGDYGNSTRAALIAGSEHVKGYDAVVVQEAFDNKPSEVLKTGLRDQYPHQTPVLGRSTSGWDDTQGAYSALTPEDGGVTVLSRWPITRQVQYVFSRGCGADWFSNKGFVYAKLSVRGQPVHLIGTHLQADDSLCRDAPGVRRSQFQEMRTFVDRLAVPRSEQVLFSGDLNIDRGSPEYDSLRSALDVEAPQYRGHPYSWDPERNALTSGRNGEGPRQHLDYVLARSGHRGAKAWSNTVLTPQSPPWTAGGSEYRDYSDHYPVGASNS